MSWSQLQSLFDGQGLVFWAAVTAVTLGLTLLSVSIVFQVRKLAGTSWLRLKRHRRPPASPPKMEATPRVTFSGDSYHPTGLVPAPAAPTTSGDDTDPQFTTLLTKLQAAADRLENLHAAQTGAGRQTAPSAHSPLKSALMDVDYVYKTGRA